MIKRLILISLVCFTNSMFVSCDSESDTFVATGDKSYFAPVGTDPIQFQVDSVIFNPIIGGTEKIASTSIWTLEPASVAEDAQPYFVSIRSTDSGSVDRQRFIWDFQTDGVNLGRHTQQLNGVSYVSLVTPFTLQSRWDALQNEDLEKVVTIAGEPLLIHKDWTQASVDSIGPYSLPDGSSVEAVFISLTDAENFVELREFKEIYGKGLGLLERNQRFLDTQQSASRDPWEDKAENGFTVQMKRLF